MYTSINDILKDLTKANNVTYPVKYNHGEYTKEGLWNLLKDNLQTKYNYFNVVGNFLVENQYYFIIAREFSENDFERASKVIEDRIAVGSYTETLSGEFHPAYLAVLEDAKVNGNNNVSPEVVSKFLELENVISDFDMIVYVRLITNNGIHFLYRKNPEFKEFVSRFANVMRLIREAAMENPELQ